MTVRNRILLMDFFVSHMQSTKKLACVEIPTHMRSKKKVGYNERNVM